MTPSSLGHSIRKHAFTKMKPKRANLYANIELKALEKESQKRPPDCNCFVVVALGGGPSNLVKNGCVKSVDARGRLDGSFCRHCTMKSLNSGEASSGGDGGSL